MDPRGLFQSEYSDSIDNAAGGDKAAIYLDSAGSAVPSQKMLAAVFADIARGPQGNPHSSAAAQDAVNGARTLVLEYFNLSRDQYDIVFTSGATAALKLVGESFPFGESGAFAYPLNAHTSMLGLRCYSENVFAYHPHDIVLGARGGADRGTLVPQRLCCGDGSNAGEGDICYNLFGTVGECNFSGAQADLSLTAVAITVAAEAIRSRSICIKQSADAAAASGGWLWLLDASKLVQSSRLAVSELEPLRRPHFIALSFYKMFGYPTGLGALLLRRDASGLLRKRYFGGGTVLAASASSDFVVPRNLHPHQWLEDGSCNFHAIAALKHGFALIDRLGGIDAIHAHTAALASFTLDRMRLLEHHNGSALVCIYSGDDFGGGAQGPIIAFNVLREDSSMLGFGAVLEMATRRNIVLRAGCFCNVGACALALGTTADESVSHFARGRSCDSTEHDIIDGKSTGAVRISFGAHNSLAHCDAFLSFLSSAFLAERRSESEEPLQEPAAAVVNGSGADVMRVERLLLYPIKSCGGVSVNRWSLSGGGLNLDRAFAVVDDYSMTVLSQKAHAEMALIVPSIAADGRTMTLSAAAGSSSRALEPVTIDICGEGGGGVSGETKLIRVCGRQVGMSGVSPAADRWLSSFLNKACSLVRYVDSENDTCDASSGHAAVKAFSNTADFLVVSRESLQELSRRIHQTLPEAHVSSHGGYDEESLIHNLRPNIVLGGGRGPHFEDHLHSVTIGGGAILTSVGQCERCSVVDVGARGARTCRVLEVLAGYRQTGGGRATFGHLMRLQKASLKTEGGLYLETGAVVTTLFINQCDL